MLKTNAAIAIKRVSHARNSVCLKCFRSLRACDMAVFPLYVISKGVLKEIKSPSSSLCISAWQC